MQDQIFNPYLPSYEYVPDGEPHVFGNRVYIYGSHDKFNGTQFCELDYVCWSAPVDDLANWQYEGIIYRKEEDPVIGESNDRRLFAPDVTCGPDGRYYLYYAFDFSGIISVAVCDTPAGIYQYYGHVHYADGTLLGQRETDHFHYDPAVLTEGQRVFLYSGFCPDESMKRFSHLSQADGAMFVELQSDMLTVIHEPKTIIPSQAMAAGTDFAGHAFFEAPSIRKIGTQYYFIYSSQQMHELCYAISNFPDRGFRYGGTIISNGDIGIDGRTKPLNYTGTNHGGIEKIQDRYYVFYHRQTNGNPYSRQGCAEKISILADGSIPQVPVTSCGLNQAPLRGTGEYDAGIACILMSRDGAIAYEAQQTIDQTHPYITQSGEDRENHPDQYIANLRSGAVVGYRYFDLPKSGSVTIHTRGTKSGCVEIRTSQDGAVIAEIPTSTGPEWLETRADYHVKPGVHELWFRFIGEGSMEFRKFYLDS